MISSSPVRVSLENIEDKWCIHEYYKVKEKNIKFTP